MGSICARGPRGSLAPAAYAQLNTVVELAQSAHFYSPRVGTILPTLFRLQQKAHQAVTAVGPGPSSSIGPSSQDREDDHVSEDEFAAYGGVARVILRRGSSISAASYSPKSHSIPSARESPDALVDPHHSAPSQFQSHTQQIPPMTSQGQGQGHSRRPSAPDLSTRSTGMPFDMGLGDTWSVPISGLIHDKTISSTTTHGHGHGHGMGVGGRSNSISGPVVSSQRGENNLTWMENYGFPTNVGTPGTENIASFFASRG